MSEEPEDKVSEVLNQLDSKVPEALRSILADRDKYEKRARKRATIVISFCVLISCFAVVLSVIAAQSSAMSASKFTVNAARLDSLRQANQQLYAQGLPTIPIPENQGEPVNPAAVAEAASAIALSNLQKARDQNAILACPTGSEYQRVTIMTTSGARDIAACVVR